jgi:disulfide oxidoreductase YuzD
MMKNKKIKWFSEPEEHDYPAAESYLNLIYADTKGIILRLKSAEISHFKAKDIFRASGLSLLGISNSQVKKNIKKINNGEKMSPILLVRDSLSGKVIIADGYHRMCSIFMTNDNLLIPCKIVSL